MKIGFIGQGFIGRAYATNFIKRGYSVICYSLEPEYIANKDEIKNCDIVFIAVPTPTTPAGFDFSLIEKVLPLIGTGKIAVIKSTIIPGTTNYLQEKFPALFILHSPEFLTEKTCQFDADYPKRNVIGVSNRCLKEQAQQVMDILPEAEYKLICGSEEAEAIKYASNCFLYLKILFTNTLWDLCTANRLNYEVIKEAMIHDSRIGLSHNDPVHDGGRGAGGHCFIKDFAAYRNYYEQSLPEAKSVSSEISQTGLEFLKQAEAYNRCLLFASNKNLDLLEQIYGDRK